ncbi:MAG: hypothetical protein JW994_07415 [Candidatus Omnitrophica bacterium]|nr:hypothetical protein [Candidatus Omnitrophota bacterium]
MNRWTKKAKNEFQFYTSVKLRELTGMSAHNLRELVAVIKEIPGSSIYYHTHVFLQRHQSRSPEPPNDFAYWVSNILGEYKLGEELASIDICSFGTIRELRERIISAIEKYLFETKEPLRQAPQGMEFDFIKAHSFIVPTGHKARNLKEFAMALDNVTIHSIYFHIFEAKLRLEKGINDFSFWIGTSAYAPELARAIASLDPYTFTMEGLRRKLIEMIGLWCAAPFEKEKNKAE